MPAVPKHKRIEDPELIEKLEALNQCDIPGCKTPQWHPIPHHIKTQGSGGDDVSENLCNNCVPHHGQAHTAQLSKAFLKQCAQDRIRRVGY